MWDTHPPLVRARLVSTVARLAYEVETLSELVEGMYAVGITRFGQRGDGATCGALLDLADRLEEWRVQ
jgi:hypothetical protein